jgi:thiosulfate reductase/polysulfide reductase chain A
MERKPTSPKRSLQPSRAHLPSRRDALRTGCSVFAGLATGQVIRLAPDMFRWPSSAVEEDLELSAVNDYRRAVRVPSVCLNCSTVCGIVGYVIDGKLVKISGNPEDPNNGKTLCAKGQAGVVIPTYPERLVYPLRRVGRRGEGLWRRISWEEAYSEMVARIRKCLEAGHPEWVAVHIGRSRINDVITRFLHALGSPVFLNHRALCSLNKRAANYAVLGDTDWETVDAERTRYFLNFGSNFYECHQGAIHFLKRVVRARAQHGAKLVTFDVRLSNTAGRSDEWFAPFPGTEGAIALAMAHTIVQDGTYDRLFVEKWTNVTVKELQEFLKPYTPEWAEAQSGIAAADIRRVAREFIACRPRCAAFTNRGSHAHYNGFNNDRAVLLLNALAGSIHQPGGYCLTEYNEVPEEFFPLPEPVPPAPKVRTDLEDPPEYPLANYWQKMRVGQIVYAYLQEGRAKLEVYFSYTLGAPQTWPEGRSRTVEVLKDERLIPFHVCSDIVYSEMAHYADLILPDATYLERWGLDARNNYELQPYVTLRQPIVPPPSECRSFADVLIELGRRLGDPVAKYFPFRDHEEYTRLRCRRVPPGDCADGWEYMRRHGVFVLQDRPKCYGLHERPLGPSELEGSHVDPATGVIYRYDPNGKKRAVGIVQDGQAVRGFRTPSRKVELRSTIVAEQAAKVGVADDGWPHYVPIPAHQELQPDSFILVSFKWHVHTQARTAPQKYLSEIVHDNPLWIHTSAAERLGLQTGDWVEITTYRLKGRTYRGTGQVLGTARVRVFVTEGIHPRVVALSNSLGFLFSGRAATARQGRRPRGPGYDEKLLREDRDLVSRLWWSRQRGGKGNGFNINAILPIAPAPVTGMQAWYDTVCTLRRASGPA